MMRTLPKLRRSNRRPAGNEDADLAIADQEDTTTYAEVLREFGLPRPDLAIDETARRVAASPIRQFLLAALDDWAIMVPAGRSKLLSVALRADDDLWRRNCRDALLKDDRPRLLALAKQPDAIEQVPATVVLARHDHWWLRSTRGDRVSRSGAAASPRRPVDQLYDVKVSLRAASATVREGDRFLESRPGDSTRSPIILSKLGTALVHTSQFDEAIADYREAIRLAPDLANVHTALSGVLLRQGKLEEAVAEARTAARLNPDNAYTHVCLSYALFDQGKLKEALAEARTAVRLKPSSPHAHICLSDPLVRAMIA